MGTCHFKARGMGHGAWGMGHRAQGTELRAQGKTQPSTQHPVTYINHRN